MELSGLNMRNVRAGNRATLIRLMLACGNLSRKELSERMGLTGAAITKLTAQLVHEGVLTEVGEADDGLKRAGRREILLSLTGSGRKILGINAETADICLSVTDMGGRLIAREQIDFTKDYFALVNRIDSFLADNSLSKKDLSAVGICVVGSKGEKGFGLWDEVGLSELIGVRYGLPVTLSNNIRAFAEAELLYGNVEYDGSVLFFKWGPGIGSAIARDGKIIEGSGSGVAELGHFIVNPGGKLCRCGRRGCLETEAGLGKLSDVRLTPDFERKLDLTALALTNAATILDAGRIVLFGSAFTKKEITEELITRCISYNSNLSRDMITTSGLNDRLGYVGPAAICAERFLIN